jgi:hypothetical protein
LITNFVSLHKSSVERTADAAIGASNTTPLHLFALVRTYASIYDGKRKSRGSESSHLKKGLDKLRDAATLVDKLTAEA